MPTYRNSVSGRTVQAAEPRPDLEGNPRWERTEDSPAAPTAATTAERPAGNASAETWRAYAVAAGMSREEAETLSRDELRDRYPG